MCLDGCDACMLAMIVEGAEGEREDGWVVPLIPLKNDARAFINSQ